MQKISIFWQKYYLYSKQQYNSCFRDFLQSMTKIMGKTAIWEISCFCSLPPLNNVEKQWAKFVSSNVMGSQHRIGGEGDFWTQFSKFPSYFITGCLKFRKKRKHEILFIHFQVTTICFNESDYIMLHSIMNIMAENGAKMMHKMSQ